jgi:flagellar hook-length control protein FliK
MQTDLLILQDQNEVFSTGIKSEKGKGDYISKALESDDLSEVNDADFLSTLIAIKNDQEMSQLECLALLNSSKGEVIDAENLELRAEDSGFRVQGSEVKAESSGLKAQSLELKVEISELIAESTDTDEVTRISTTIKETESSQVSNQEAKEAEDSGFRVQGSEVKAESSGLKAQSLELKVEISELIAESTDTDEVTRISTTIKETESSQVSNQEAKEAEDSGFRVQGSEVKAESSQPEAQRSTLKAQSLNSNHQEAGEVVKNLIKNQASHEATPKIESNFQDIKTIAKNMENFDKNFSHKDLDNVLLFPESRSSDKVSDTGLHAKETQLTQKPLQTEILTQIVKKAAFNLKNGQTKVKIDLKPEFLGRIQLMISTENQQVMVRMLTEIPLVKDIIENNINHLKADLQNHGLEIDKFDVFLTRDSDQHENGHENGHENAEFLKKNGETDEGESDGILAKEMEKEAQFVHERTGTNLIGVFA